MRIWLEKMAWKMQRFMMGRNGLDDLARHLYILGWVFIMLNIFFNNAGLYILSLVVLGYALFRMSSKNVVRRQQENTVYLGLISKPKRTWLQWQRRWKERKTHCFFRCQCGTMLRVPKGKGEVIITCPNCHRQMTKRT